MRRLPSETQSAEESRAALATLESEDSFKDWLIKELKERGWLVMHSRPAMNRNGRWMTPIQGHPGFPDIVAVRPQQRRNAEARLLIIETKAEREKPRPDQQQWLGAFDEVLGVEVHVLRPSDRAFAERLVA